MNDFNLTDGSSTADTSTHSLGSWGCAAAALLLSIGLLHGAPAMAGPSPSDARSSNVALTDLDLSTAAGQRVAQERLHGMARTLCSRLADDLDLSHHENYLKCVSKADDDALMHLQALISHQSNARFAKADIQ